MRYIRELSGVNILKICRQKIPRQAGVFLTTNTQCAMRTELTTYSLLTANGCLAVFFPATTSLAVGDPATARFKASLVAA